MKRETDFQIEVPNENKATLELALEHLGVKIANCLPNTLLTSIIKFSSKF